MKCLHSFDIIGFCNNNNQTFVSLCFIIFVYESVHLQIRGSGNAITFFLFHFDVELRRDNAAKMTQYQEIVPAQFLSLHRPTTVITTAMNDDLDDGNETINPRWIVTISSDNQLA